MICIHHISHREPTCGNQLTYLAPRLRAARMRQSTSTQRQRNGDATATQRQRNRTLATRPSTTRPCDCKNARDVEMKPMENLISQTPRHLTESLRKLDSQKLLDNDIDGQLIKGLAQEWNDGTRILQCDGTTCLAHAPHGYGYRV